MAWQIKEAKKQKRGSKVVGARLVFDNGEPEIIMVPNPDYGLIPDPAAEAPEIMLGQDEDGADVLGPDPAWERPLIPNGAPLEVERTNPDYKEEEKVWGRDKEQTAAQFKTMVLGERDAWLAHYDREDPNVPEAPGSLVEEDL